MSGSEMSERIQRLVADDRLIPLFGIEVEEASESLARVSAVVKEEFLQVHGLAHGAFVFALIDVAFALNVNAKVDAVAVQWSISQFRSGTAGGEAHRRMPPAARRTASHGRGPCGHRRRREGDRQGAGDRPSPWAKPRWRGAARMEC